MIDVGINVSNIRFSYTDEETIKGLSFNCKKNRIYGIIGPNGCGKTTTLKIMAGYLTPKSGDVTYDGKNILKIPPKEAAKVRAVVEQKIYSPFVFPVFDYVMLGRMPYLKAFVAESRSDYDIVNNALSITQVTHLKDKNIDALSGGELQRVMIARALAQCPQYLMLDEPTSHLDIRQQLELMQLLRRLSSDMTIIMVIHELNQASLYCDDLVLMEKGKIVSHGSGREVLTSKNIYDVFGVTAIPINEFTNGVNYTFSLPVHLKRQEMVHVICGGGSGSKVMTDLNASGMKVSAGILAVNDQDHNTAKNLGIIDIQTEPFNAITDKMEEDLIGNLLKSDCIVLTIMYIGKGNIKNLEAVLKVIDQKTVFFVGNPEEISHYDFTGGKGVALYNKIIKTAIVVSSSKEIIDYIDNLTFSEKN